jgi:hypothetical protein
MDVVAFVSYHNSSASLRQVLNSNHKEMLNASPSGIALISETQNFSIYPNPSNGNIFVSGDLHPSKKPIIEIFNLTGQVVGSYIIDTANTEVPTSQLNAGMYFYRITAGGTTLHDGKLSLTR